MEARPRLGLAALLATAASLACAAPSMAAFAPTFDLKVDPATANSASTITSTITQQPGEIASKTVTVTLPAGFSPNPSNTLAACTTPICGPDSRMGTATASSPSFGAAPISGPVYFGGTAGAAAFKLIMALPLATLVGTAGLQPDGTVTTVFDNLPAILINTFTLVLDGGDKALLRTPSKCGNYTSNASFVGQTGEQSSASSPMTISGCSASGTGTAPGSGASPTGAGTTPSAAPLQVGLPKLSRAGVVSFSLSKAARVTVTVTKGGKRVSRRTVSGRKGANRVRMGKRVRKGRYRVSLRAVDAQNKRTVVRARSVRLR